MKLEEAVSIGRFCGLHSVEECMDNIFLHYNIFSYKTLGDEFYELIDEYKAYTIGTLTLDFDAIDKKVEEDIAEYEHQCMKELENMGQTSDEEGF